MTVPALERPEALWERGARERRYWDEHERELQARYPERFVAVRAGAVVATAADLHELVQHLQSLSVPPGEVSVQYMDRPERPRMW